MESSKQIKLIDYELLKILDQGANGKVYIARRKIGE
jgi:hypothetical protein